MPICGLWPSAYPDCVSCCCVGANTFLTPLGVTEHQSSPLPISQNCSACGSLDCEIKSAEDAWGTQGSQALQRNLVYCYFAPEIGENFDSLKA